MDTTTNTADDFVLPKGKKPEQVTIKLWKGDRFYFQDYDSAAIDMAVGRKCSICGKPTSTTYYLLCDECLQEKENERYNKMPFKEWDGVTPLWVYDTDKYLFGEDDVFDYADEIGVEAKDLNLVISDPVETPEFDIEDFLLENLEMEPEYMEDILSSSNADELNKTINEAIKNIVGSSVNLWKPGKYRTNI